MGETTYSRLLLLLLLCSGLLCATSAVSVHGTVTLPSSVLGSKQPLKHRLDYVTISLQMFATDEMGRGLGQTYRTYTKYDLSFTLPDVPEGVHSLEVYHPHYLFPTYMLMVSKSGRVKATSMERKKNGQAVQEVFATASLEGQEKSADQSQVLTLTAVGNYQYFKKRQGVSITKMMMNPMFLMMAFSLGLMFLVPKLTEGMDPEDFKQIQEDQKKNKSDDVDPQKMLNDLLGMKQEDTDSDSD